MIARLREIAAWWRWLRGLAAQAAAIDDAMFAADTAALRAFDARQRPAVVEQQEHPPTGCPIFDCPTCEPDPCEVPVPRQRVVARVSYWLRTECPEAFNEVNWGRLDRLSAKLLALHAAGEIPARWESEVTR